MLEAIVAVYSDWGIGASGTQPVVVKADDTVLTEGKDYKLRYLDEDGDLISTIKKPGTYIPVVIEAKSRNFTGQVEGEEFDVKKA